MKMSQLVILMDLSQIESLSILNPLIAFYLQFNIDSFLFKR